MGARRDRFAICLAAMACAAALTIPVCATAGGYQATLDMATVTIVSGNPGVTSPLAPPNVPNTVMITGTPVMASSNSNGAASHDEQRGPDEKWGDPLSAKLVDTDRVQAGFHYYAGSGWNGSQGGVGFSLTFKN